MAMELVAQGGISSLLGIGAFEDEFAEGDLGLLTIRMRLVPSSLEGSLQAALDRTPGLPEMEVAVADNAINISWRKGLLPLMPLALVLAIFFIGAILLLVTSWALFRSAGPAIATVAAGGLGIGLLMVLYLIFRSRRPARADEG